MLGIQKQNWLIIINKNQKAYEFVTFGEPGTVVIETSKVAIEGI